MPFQGADDAKRYLLEYSLIVALLAFGVGSIPTSRLGAIVGTVCFAIGAWATDRIMGRRGRLLPPLPRKFPRRAAELHEIRAMQALRLKYYRSALKAIDVTPNLVVPLLAVAAGLGCAGFLLFH